MTPWTVVTEPEALALAGPDYEIHQLDGVTVATADRVVLVAPARDEIGRTGVWSADTFRLRGTMSEALSRLLTKSFQAGVVGLFVRTDDGCVYLGRTRSRVITQQRNGTLLRVDSGIEPPLPSELLDRVRPDATAGMTAGAVEPDWLDLVVTDPLAALTGFASWWYGDPELVR